MADDVLSDKTGKELVKSINTLIKSITNPNKGFGGSYMPNQNQKSDESTSNNIVNDILTEKLEKQKEYIKLKNIERSIDEDILKNNAKNLPLEKEKENMVKAINDLEVLRNRNTSGMSKTELKEHEKRLKLAEKDIKTHEKSYSLSVKNIEVKKKEEKLRKKYYQEHKKEIDEEAKKRKAEEEKKERRQERRDKRSKKRKEFLDDKLSPIKDKYWNNADETIFGFFTKTLNNLLQQDSIMSKLSANYSLTRKESGLLKENILSASITTAFIGVKTEDLVKMQSAYTDELGRSVMLNEEGMIALSNIGVATAMGTEGAAQMAAQMERFGYSAVSSASFITDLVNLTKKEGVSASVASKSFVNNLKIAQSYTFKDGISGVVKMTSFSEKLKINMSSIASLADKISSPEGAIQTAASLQVLGGSFAQMADPMTLLNQGITDMEGLTKTYSKMLIGISSLNKETGEVTINGYDRLRVKAAAEAMGVNFDEMMESARVQGKRAAIDAQVGITPVIKNVDEDTKNLIASLSQYDTKDKQFKITVGGSQKLITQLTSEDISKLQPVGQELSLRTIAENTMGLTDVIKNGFTAIVQSLMPNIINLLSNLTETIVPIFEDILDFVSTGKGKSTATGVAGGALAGAVVGSLILPGAGTTIGTLLGGTIGGFIGNGINSGTVGNDVIIPSEKNSKPIFLNKQDDIFAMKPNGAISKALTSNNPISNIFNNDKSKSNILYPTNNNETNVLSSTNAINKMYQDIYPTNSGVLPSKWSNSSTDTNKFNREPYNGKIELNVTGTINLVSPGNTSKISLNELINDKNFVRELTRIISNQMVRDTNGGKYVGGLNNNSF